ncbi:hypothetical protein [Planctobacterium marinum]|uniref:Spore coat protein U domain-containing protein n=1 Tax=Planctobacterium marinum TaxID=1631968 RepID=A0AA48HJX1_9ALTE|nr:hypothetical protein MACH26_16220 [Planctobacterium marinum]
MQTFLGKISLTVITWLVLLSTCYGAMSANSDNTISLDLAGDIEPMCKVRNNVKSRSMNLDLSSNTAQKTNNVFIWCNTGQSNAQATYSSLNDGVLVNENGDSIPYLFTVANTASNLSLATPQTVTQRTGSGTAGADKGRVIKIKPQVNGFERAGTYRDTISVTVSFD